MPASFWAPGRGIFDIKSNEVQFAWPGSTQPSRHLHGVGQPFQHAGLLIFEVDSINVGGTVRPALAGRLQSESGQQVIALVNHWTCCGGSTNQERRRQQAVQMHAFALQTPGIPIVSGGDINIPLDSGGQMNPAFLTLTQQWEYREPNQPGVGSWRGGSVLDAVFVTNRVQGWNSQSTILRRDGPSMPATTPTFTDTNQMTDHRPLLLVGPSS